jgi:hypothetical protein
MWVRADNAFGAIVTADIFARAQEIILTRSRRFTDDEMLAQLKALWAKHGRVSGLLIDEQESMPSTAAFRHRFGSLVRAYQLIGYTPPTDYGFLEINRYLRIRHPEIVQEVITRLSAMELRVERDPVNELLILEHELSVSIVLSRCLRTPGPGRRWLLRFEPSLRPDLTIAVRMNEANDAIKDYYLFPAIDLIESRTRLAECNHASLDAYRFDSLEFFFQMAERINVEDAAA